MSNEFELEGTDSLIAMLEAMDKNVSKVENAALKAAAEPVAADMRDLVHVSDRDTVHIQDNIEVSGVKKDAEGKYVLVGPGEVTAWRAGFLEFGTSKMEAAPFIQPAGEKNKDKVPEIIDQKLREGLGL
jgi:HK97 gp10 family phage protein